MGKPAARLTDMHTCPMVTPGTPPVPHVGGPISGPGAPVVLVGSLPAAVVGDMCVCVGPPDSIILGSPTVLVAGRMAARMGDPTAHGGIIAAGLPTVLIGEVGGGGLTAFCPAIASMVEMPMAARLATEQALVDALGPAADSLRDARHDRDMALLAAAPYARKDGSEPVLPVGYSAATDEDLDRLGTSREDLVPDMNVYKTTGPDGGDHYVLSYRGTELGAGGKTTRSDIGTDVFQAVGFKTDAYENGTETAKRMALSGESVEMTGHSKGGGQAAAASAATGIPATTFNAAGVHPDTLERAGVAADGEERAQKTVRAYNNERDPLNKLQDNRGKALTAIGAAANFVAGVLGAATVALLAAGGALPRALGERRTVPPAKNQPEGLLAGHSIDYMAESMNEQIESELKALCGC